MIQSGARDGSTHGSGLVGSSHGFYEDRQVGFSFCKYNLSCYGNLANYGGSEIKICVNNDRSGWVKLSVGRVGSGKSSHV